MKNAIKNIGWFSMTNEELKTLFEFRRNPEHATSLILVIVAALLGPITIFGALILGYKRAYIRFMYPNNEFPKLYDLKPITKLAMILGAIAAWLAVIAIVWAIITFLPAEWVRNSIFLYYVAANLLVSGVVYGVFKRWKNSVHNMLVDLDKHASARYATKEELETYVGDRGLYVGGGYAYDDKGHFLTFGSTRSRKGTAIIIPNVLRCCSYKGSMVVTDVKGEVFSVCARGLKEKGIDCVILNPWDLLSDCMTEKRSYNPLDILSDTESPHLIDDVAIISELICPIDDNSDNKFFVDSARNMIAGLLLHLVTSTKEKPSLTTLWEWCRYYGSQWDELLGSMFDNNHPVHGNAVRMAAQAIARQMESGETFASILSNVFQCTDFIKSSALQQSMKSDFDPYTLADGNKTVFVVCPADKLKSHATWLKLVTTTLMRAVVRRPKKKVTFLVDEAASALGYVSEIPVAFAAYAGFNISLWLIYQDLAQFQSIFGNQFESLLANANIKQFLSIRDNFSAKYVSEAMGQTTRTVYSKNWFGTVSNPEHIERALATPDEVKRMTKDQLIFFAGESVVVRMPKPAYYEMEVLAPNGRKLYDPNPYIENSF